MTLTNPITIAIIAVTVVISLIAFGNRNLFDKLKFNPYSIRHERQPWRFLSYGFLHADYIHLLINMMVLWSFGGVVEGVYQYFFPGIGGMLYLVLYVAGIIISVVPSYFKNKNNPNYNAVGASGAVSAIVFASILFAPNGKIYLFFIPIGIPAFIFGFLYLIYSYTMARKSHGTIGHDAHFWGAVFGIIFSIICIPTIVFHFWNEVSIFFNGIF